MVGIRSSCSIQARQSAPLSPAIAGQIGDEPREIRPLEFSPERTRTTPEVVGIKDFLVDTTVAESYLQAVVDGCRNGLCEQARTAPPGRLLSPHRHAGVEELYLLEGELWIVSGCRTLSLQRRAWRTSRAVQQFDVHKPRPFDSARDRLRHLATHTLAPLLAGLTR